MAHKDQQAAPAQSARDLSPWTDAATSTLLGNDLMDEADSQATSQPALPSYQESKKRAPHITTASTSSSSSVPPKMGSRTFLRRLGHKLNPCHRFKDMDNNEPLEKVYSNSRLSALWHFILFYLPAILVTSTLLVLYITNIHWNPSHPTVEELAALQFAAKIQESLILISLTDVLLHRIRYGLLSRNGIPLGFLSSPFNIGFSLRYLVSREFWAPSLNPTAKRLINTFTTAIILLFALLGLAAGPSSAIAMIPRYDWWQLSTTPYMSSVVKRDPFAIKLDSQHIPTDQYESLSANQTCANQNLSTILQALKTLDPSSVMLEPTLLGNITAPSPFAPPHRQITLAVNSDWVRSSTNKHGGMIAYAVTPMEFILSALQAEWSVAEGEFPRKQYLIKSEAMEESGKEKWKQPPVAVYCAHVMMHRPFGTSATFSFKETLYDAFTVTLDFKGLNGTIEYLMNIPTNAGNDTTRSVKPMLLDMQHILRAPIAASILFAHSYIIDMYSLDSHMTDTYSADSESSEFGPEAEIGLCLVQARWVEADVWFYPKESQDIQSHLEFPLSNAMKYMRQNSGPEDAIKMTVEWLTDIGVPPGSANSTRENPAYLHIMKSCTDQKSPGLLLSTCLPGGLAAYFANALAQTTALKDQISSTPDANSTVVYNTYFEHVYAYGFRASTTLRLAFSALFLHVIIALIHLAVTLFVRRPWHSSAWGNFSQMLTLALGSKPPDELSNVGAGVPRSWTWKLVMVVREVGEGGQLEMAVRAPTAMSRRGQINTDAEERGAAEMRIPQVGTKYG